MQMKFSLFVVSLGTLMYPLFSHAECTQQLCDDRRNTFLGNADVFENGNGTDNTSVGWDALSEDVSSFNTDIGSYALYGIFSGHNNTAVGYSAMYDYDGLDFNGTGSNNTAMGSLTLYSYTSGSNNTATGYSALYSLTTANDNTADGYQALYFNTAGAKNVAVGRGALYNNTTANNNTAVGYQALNQNKTGTSNTATGYRSLQNATGGYNTADGYQSLNKNTTGFDNLASGMEALYSNVAGNYNTATGYRALYSTNSSSNTADGEMALYSDSSGFNNTGIGIDALFSNTTGTNNIALGSFAGLSLTTGGFNIDIGNVGVAGESSTIRFGTNGTQTNTYIAGINGATVAGGIGVIIDSTGHLGTTTSSARYKDNIRPMNKASEAILSLHPVSFRYKQELDPKGIPQFGLVAEEVEKVNPDLVARDEQGKPYTVRYEAVNAMLLNEFLKEHRKVEEQEATITQLKSADAKQEVAIARQQKEIKALAQALKEQAAQIQKISLRSAGDETAPHVVSNNQ